MPQSLFLVIRPMRCSKQPPEQTYRYPQKQEDHREGCERRGEGEKRNEQRTTEFQGCEDQIADPAREDGGIGPERCGEALREAGDAAPAMMAAVHFTIGGKSVMTAADTIVPATNAAGVARASSKLSIPGM